MGKRGPPARKGAPTTIRFEPALRERLEAAAANAGRSLSEEVSARLELSLDDLERRFGDLETYALCQLIALAFRDIHRYAGKAWFEDPYSYGHAKDALAELFTYFQPKDIVPDKPAEVAAPHPLSPEFRTAKAKATLQNFPVGVVVAHAAVLHLEASLEQSDLLDGERLRAIAKALLPRLVGAGMAGEAAIALSDIDESQKGST